MTNLGAKRIATMTASIPAKHSDGASAPPSSREDEAHADARTTSSGRSPTSWRRAPSLLAALVRPKTSAALREKVMLGVTSVTDCRSASGVTRHWAMAHGVPLEEVNQILGQQIESLEAKNPAEAAAILFAQHYAENLDRFDPESIENLRKYYSDAQVAEILAYVRASRSEA